MKHLPILTTIHRLTRPTNSARGLAVSLAAVSLALACLVGCSKDPAQNRPTPGETVMVTLPALVTAQPDTEAAPAAAQAVSQAKEMQRDREEGLLHVSRRCAAATPTTGPQATATRATATRAAHPALENVWVLQFATDGTTLQCKNIGTIAENATPEVPLTIAKNCTIYIVANGPATGFAPANLTAFQTMGIDPTSSTGTIYSGKMDNASIETYQGQTRIIAEDGVPSTLWLKAIGATLNVKLSLDVPGWELASIELYNVPKQAGYVTQHDGIYPAEGDENFLYTQKKVVGWACTPVTSGQTSTGSWNVPDNRRGTVAGIAKESDRNHTNAPANATFVRIRIVSSAAADIKATFDIYPGPGDLGDFNLIRNHIYTLNVTIEGTEEDLNGYIANDERVALCPIDLSLNGSANCYIVNKAGTAYMFDARVKGNGKATLTVNDPNVYAGPLGNQRALINASDDLIAPKGLNPQSAFTLWTTGSAIDQLIKDIQFEAGYVFFTTVGAKKEALTQGNAVIAVKDADGNIIWSWHIWATDYNPATDDQTYITRAMNASGTGDGAYVATAQRSFTIMGSNLGSINNTPGSIGSFGLLYQWGRKDPFIGSATVFPGVNETTAFGNQTAKTTTATPVDTYKWQALVNSTAGTGADASIAYGIAHPTHFLFRKDDTGPSDWMNVNTIAEQRDYLWANPNPNSTIPNLLSGSKSIYDPCPPGYRIPQQDSWTRFTTTGQVSITPSEWNTTATTWLNGQGWTFYCINDRTGPTTFFPATGLRNHNSGILINAGIDAYYWTATPYYGGHKGGSSLRFYNSGGNYNLDPLFGINRAYGLSVRCAKE